jgi:hypothetical protein
MNTHWRPSVPRRARTHNLGAITSPPNRGVRLGSLAQRFSVVFPRAATRACQELDSWRPWAVRAKHFTLRFSALPGESHHSIGKLSPRLRQTLELLLQGESESEKREARSESLLRWASAQRPCTSTSERCTEDSTCTRASSCWPGTFATRDPPHPCPLASHHRTDAARSLGAREFAGLTPEPPSSLRTRAPRQNVHR